MIRSVSSQEDESVFLDEGLFEKLDLIKILYRYFEIDDDPTTINKDTPSGKTNSFFIENYDHTTIEEEEISIREIQRRKSVSSRFRSVSKEITYEILIKIIFILFCFRMTDTLSTSGNTTQEDISTSTRTIKNLRSQIMNTIEPKTAPPRSSTIRKTRSKSSGED
jgi:hypothetical protein